MSGRIRQTELAVLGALSVEPATGYAVREAIRDVLGHFWSESFGQIYPTLSELERQGHIQRSGGARAGSSVFALTESGMTRFRELLGEPVQTALPRNGALLRLFFGRTVGREGCRELLLGALSDAERRLVEFEAVAREMSADEAHALDLPFWQLTVSAGQHTARATAVWATQALAALDVLPASAFAEQEERA